jgi:hypothetical protein
VIAGGFKQIAKFLISDYLKNLKKQVIWQYPQQGIILMSLKSGRLHEKHAVATRTWEPSQHLLEDRRKIKKACVEMAGHRTFRMHTDY